MAIPKIAGVIKNGSITEERLPLYRFSLRFIEHSEKLKMCFIEKEIECDSLYGDFEPIVDEIKAVNLETDFFDLIELFEKEKFSEYLNNSIFFDMSINRSQSDFFTIPVFGNTMSDYKEYKHLISNCDFNNISLKDFELLLSRYNTKIDVSYLPYSKGGYQKIMYNDNSAIDNSKIMVVYFCYSVLDILVSFLHYCKSKNYKIEKCLHCGKYYFKNGDRTGSRRKFCTRKSPVPGYTHLNCEQAVRNIKQRCTRIKNRIETKAQLSENNSYCNYVWKFQNECNNYKNIINESPTVENITKYMEFLKYTEKEKEWLNNG